MLAQKLYHSLIPLRLLQSLCHRLQCAQRQDLLIPCSLKLLCRHLFSHRVLQLIDHYLRIALPQSLQR